MNNKASLAFVSLHSYDTLMACNMLGNAFLKVSMTQSPPPHTTVTVHYNT